MSNNLKDMFTSWAYWKPIVVLVGGASSVALLLIYGNAIMIGCIFGIALIGFLLFVLHMVGAACYESYMDRIKHNYKRLTDKDYDE